MTTTSDNGWISGGKDLKASGEYTLLMCDSILDVWEKNRILIFEPVVPLEHLLKACPWPTPVTPEMPKARKEVQTVLNFRKVEPKKLEHKKKGTKNAAQVEEKIKLSSAVSLAASMLAMIRNS